MTEDDIYDVLDELIDTFVEEIDNNDKIVISATSMDESYRIGVSWALSRVIELRRRFG